MFLLVENYQIDHSVWSSDRTGIFEQTSCPKSLGCHVIGLGFGARSDMALSIREKPVCECCYGLLFTIVATQVGGP